MSNSSDSSTHADHEQHTSMDSQSPFLSNNSTNDSKGTTDENANSINIHKPLAVVKPIIAVKSGLVIVHDADRKYVDGETSSTSIVEINETTVSEQQATTKPTPVVVPHATNNSKASRRHGKSKKERTSRSHSRERHRSNDEHRRQHDQVITRRIVSATQEHVATTLVMF
jgi:hypothetical protein